MNLISALLETHKADKMTPQKRADITVKRLKDLVYYSKANSTYFKNLYKDLPTDFSLQDIPPTNKIDMMHNFNDWLTDSKITMSNINIFTKDIDNVGRLLDKKYLVFMTSGSTGNPAVVLYDKSNISVTSAVAACRTFARNQDYAKFRKMGKKTAGLFANHGFYLACGMSRYLSLKFPFLRNKITVDVNAPTKTIVKELNDFQPSMLSGYPSSLSVLCEQQNVGNLHISPAVIITGGEQLTASVRKQLSNTFDCYVQTHYSCTEAGEIACECENGHLHINDDWIIVEPVDYNNNPVCDGTMSDKILVTNLSNFIQPFIRYEVTDRVIVHSETCGCGKTSKWIEIEGRTDDILDFGNGVKIAPMSFYKILSHINDINRFQLIQTGNNTLELRIVSDNKDAAYKMAKQVIEEFMTTKGISISVELSNKPPQSQPISGKFKHVYADFNNASEK